MWPPSQNEPPARVPFQTFENRRRQRNRVRIILVALLVLVVGGVIVARPYFPGAEAKVRSFVGGVFKRG